MNHQSVFFMYANVYVHDYVTSRASYIRARTHTHTQRHIIHNSISEGLVKHFKETAIC